jgi:hypothetical protein
MRLILLFVIWRERCAQIRERHKTQQQMIIEINGGDAKLDTR